MKRTSKYLLPGALALAFVTAPVAVPTVFAQDTTAAAPAAANQEEKAALDKKFRDNRTANRKVAYETAKEYLQKFGNDTDNADFVKYLRDWIPKYEQTVVADEQKARADRFVGFVSSKNSPQVFTAAREWLAAEPDNFYPMFVTVDYGFGLASGATPVNDYNAQTIELAKQAISKIEAGKTPKLNWSDYKFRDEKDALAWMNYMIGYILFANEKGKEAESVPYLYKAMQYESSIKNSKPLAYYALGFHYRDLYNKGVKEFQDKSAGATELTPELKELAGKNKALADRAIDAFARAVKIATDTKNANKDAWTKDLTEVYKARNSGQTTGMDAYVASVLTKPLPDPSTPVTPVLEETPAATTGTSNATTTTTTATPSSTATTPSGNTSTSNSTTSGAANRPRATTPNANTSTTPANNNTNTTTTPKPAPKKPSR